MQMITNDSGRQPTAPSQLITGDARAWQRAQNVMDTLLDTNFWTGIARVSLT